MLCKIKGHFPVTGMGEKIPPSQETSSKKRTKIKQSHCHSLILYSQKKVFRNTDDSPRSHSGLHPQHICSWRIQGDESFGKEQKETFGFSFAVIFNKATDKEIIFSTITTTESDMRNVLIILSLTLFLKIEDYTESCHDYKNQCALIQSMLRLHGLLWTKVVFSHSMQDSFVKDFCHVIYTQLFNSTNFGSMWK